MKLKKINEAKYKEWHIKIHKDLDKEFEEMKDKYNTFGLDSTNKSEIVRMLIYNLINDFKNNSDGEYELHRQLRKYRGA